MKIRIVGAGLVGTSIGLGLRQNGHQIMFSDTSAQNLKIAQDLMGESLDFKDADLVVIATPVGATFEILKSEFERNPKAAFIDITGLKSKLVAKVEDFPVLAKRFCGTHPMAGREIAGPTGARSDLFQGATWILSPTTNTSPDVFEMAKRIVLELGANVKEVPAEAHDRAISTVSHLPQILSSVLAGLMNDLDEQDITLAGQGLRDMTRLADSNPQLWSELLIANVSFLEKDIEKIQKNLSILLDALKSNEINKVEKILTAGNSGKRRIPGKHGKPSREYAYLPIVIDDKPGQLSSIFEQCETVSVNVEDLFIEHSPGQETGLITLALSPADAVVLHQHLSQKNWRVHEIRAQR